MLISYTWSPQPDVHISYPQLSLSRISITRYLSSFIHQQHSIISRIPWLSVRGFGKIVLLLLLLLQLSSHPLSPGKQYFLTYDLTLAPSTKDMYPLLCVFLFVRPYGTNCLVTFEQDTKISNSVCDCCREDKRDGLMGDNG